MNPETPDTSNLDPLEKEPFAEVLVQQYEELLFRMRALDKNLIEALRILEEDFEEVDDDDDEPAITASVQIARAIFSPYTVVIVGFIGLWVWLIAATVVGR